MELTIFGVEAETRSHGVEEWAYRRRTVVVAATEVEAVASATEAFEHQYDVGYEGPWDTEAEVRYTVSIFGTEDTVGAKLRALLAQEA